jgi:hypothetical protein
VEVTGEITATKVSIHFDEEDLASDISDNIDWSDKISENIDWDEFLPEHVGSEVESLLDQYDENTSPCRVGESFEKAVWWAMSRQADNDDNYVAAASNGSAPEGLRGLIREELKSLVSNL